MEFDVSKVRSEWSEDLKGAVGWFSDFTGNSTGEPLSSYVSRGCGSSVYGVVDRGYHTFPFQRIDSGVNYRYFYPDDSAEVELESSNTEPVSSKFPKVVSFTCNAGYKWGGRNTSADGWENTIGIFDCISGEAALYWLVDRNTGKPVSLVSHMGPLAFCFDEVKKLSAKEARKILRKVVLANVEALKETKQ